MNHLNSNLVIHIDQFSELFFQREPTIYPECLHTDGEDQSYSSSGSDQIVIFFLNNVLLKYPMNMNV